jgi:hypothetical protein
MMIDDAKLRFTQERKVAELYKNGVKNVSQPFSDLFLDNWHICGRHKKAIFLSTISEYDVRSQAEWQ